MEDDRERCFLGETDEKTEKSGRRKDREEESDEERDREGETACLNSEVRKATTRPRKSILLKTPKVHWQNQVL